jgi:spermidine/putrescine-binding protein
MKVLASALTCMLVGAANAVAQQYDYVTSFQPSLTNSVVTIKASKAPLIYYSCYNPNGSDVFVQIFDKPNSAAVALGTTAANRVLVAPALSGTGPQQLTPPFNAKNGLQVAATTTSSGSAAPSGPIDCEFGYR